MGYGYGIKTNHAISKATSKEGKAMKTVFENSMVAHVWAQQNQDHGRSNNGNFYFYGKTIFSYGEHFPIARIAENRLQTGARVIFFNRDWHSVATSGHKSDTRNALSRSDIVVYLPELRAFYRYAISRERHSDSLYRVIGQYPENARDIWRIYCSEFKCNIRFPRDPAKWFNAEKAKRNKAVLREKIETEKRRLARALAFFNSFKAELSRENVTYQLETLANHLKSETSNLRGARIKLNKFDSLSKANAQKIKRALKLAPEFGILAREAIETSKIDENRRIADYLIKVYTENSPQCVIRKLAAYAAKGESYHVESVSRDIGNALTARGVNIAPEILSAIWQEISRAYAILEISRNNIERKTTQNNESALEKFLRNDRYVRNVWGDKTYLRKHGETVETSRGASVPFNDAKRLFALAQKCRNYGVAFIPSHAVPINCGYFRLSKIDESGNTTIACHYLEFEEMQRLAIDHAPNLVKPRYPLPAII